MERHTILIACMTFATAMSACAPSSESTMNPVSEPTIVDPYPPMSTLTEERSVPTAAAATATTPVEPTTPTENAAADDIAYLWPDYVPEGYVVLPQQSVIDDQGYRLTMIGQTGDVIRVSAGNPLQLDGSRRDAEQSLSEMCAAYVCEPATIGARAGQKSNATGAGWGFMWAVDSHSYMVAVTGSATPELEAIVTGLTQLSREAWIARFDNLR